MLPDFEIVSEKLRKRKKNLTKALNKASAWMDGNKTWLERILWEFPKQLTVITGSQENMTWQTELSEVTESWSTCLEEFLSNLESRRCCCFCCCSLSSCWSWSCMMLMWSKVRALFNIQFSITENDASKHGKISFGQKFNCNKNIKLL